MKLRPHRVGMYSRVYNRKIKKTIIHNHGGKWQVMKLNVGEQNALKRFISTGAEPVIGKKPF
ncbi:MAG: hypothetical protein AB1757_00675 [Acidobacteriota bacterium]